MRDLRERIDIELLVGNFYTKVRDDLMLGPVFNKLIKEEHWPVHLGRIADFWECNLFFRPTFKGNPKQIHLQVDIAYNYQTDEHHYARWIELWCQTVDHYFQGEISELAKIRAIKMGKQLLAKVNEGKPPVEHITQNSHAPTR
jgi:hemoglobin